VTRSPQQRFNAKVDRSGGDDSCWPWMGARIPRGYGVFGLSSKQRSARAHRIAYEIAHGLPLGSLPSEWHVCHSCDNPPCVNPSHLWLGSASDNMSDAAAKGRNARSWTNGRCHRGHDITDPSNVLRFKNQRQCRLCRREWARLEQVSRRSAEEAPTPTSKKAHHQ